MPDTTATADIAEAKLVAVIHRACTVCGTPNPAGRPLCGDCGAPSLPPRALGGIADHHRNPLRRAWFRARKALGITIPS
jgi:hypothetical protein